MYIGIIGAMEEEITKLKEMMEIYTQKKISNIEFYIGKIYEKDIVLARSNEGKVNSAICTQTLILNFNVSQIINVGVAGGISPKLEIGGVAISKDTVEFDLDTTALGYKLGYTFGIESVYVECEKNIYEKIYNISKKQFNTVIGTIGSSDTFISNENKKEFLKNNFNNLIAVDMETASINHVCKINNVPFCAIRAISDITKSIEYREFINIAINNLTKVILNYIKNV